VLLTAKVEFINLCEPALGFLKPFAMNQKQVFLTVETHPFDC